MVIAMLPIKYALLIAAIMIIGIIAAGMMAYSQASYERPLIPNGELHNGNERQTSVNHYR